MYDPGEAQCCLPSVIRYVPIPAQIKQTLYEHTEDSADATGCKSVVWQDYMFQCSVRTLSSLNQHMISQLSLTASCGWRRTSLDHCCLSSRLQSAMWTPTTGLLIVRICHQDVCPGVPLLSPGLLQLTAVRHQRRATLQPRVGTYRSTLGHRCWSVWPHFTTATAAVLASRPSASHFQGPATRLPVIGWICDTLLLCDWYRFTALTTLIEKQ